MVRSITPGAWRCRCTWPLACSRARNLRASGGWAHRPSRGVRPFPRRLVLHAEPYTPQFLRGPEKILRLAVNRSFCVPRGPVVIEFGPFQLDVSGWQLRRDGKPVPLRPKTFAFLQYLAERPGELVTKRALLDAVWPGVAVTEDVLRLSARELRAALGDQATGPRYVATVPRLGYRFIATMGPAAMGGPVAARRDRHLAAGGDRWPTAARVRHRRGRDRQDHPGRRGSPRLPADVRHPCPDRARSVHRAVRRWRALPVGAGSARRAPERPRGCSDRGIASPPRAWLASGFPAGPLRGKRRACRRRSRRRLRAHAPQRKRGESQCRRQRFARSWPRWPRR